ncbi:hypothetical protein GLA29479_2642 [Lysobacter antibioticus]|nr:hypothetical protein GLA29479_2642 [Lysobacter antibioticus]
MLRVRRHEHHVRPGPWPSSQSLESISTWHLDIQKENVNVQIRRNGR